MQTFGDIDQLIWEKFICNVALGGPSIVSGLPIGELLASETWRPVATGCATEAYEVAKALGINLSFDDPVAYVDELAGLPDEDVAKIMGGNMMRLLGISESAAV